MLTSAYRGRLTIAFAMVTFLGAVTACDRRAAPLSSDASANAAAPEPRPQIPPVSSTPGLQSSDLYHLKSVGDVQISPDGSRIAYAVVSADRPGRPYSQVWVMDVASRQSTRLSAPAAGSHGQGQKPEAAAFSASNPRWSPDGRSLAFIGGDGTRRGVMIATPGAGEPRFVAPVNGTNHPLPTSGEPLTWSPDGRQIAFVSSTPGPEESANGDPMVITRYLYKPTASEGMTRFNDNARLHIFIADLQSGAVRQLTQGTYYEHSLDWSPAGDRLVFVSNHESDPDRFFNYDIFTVRVADGAVEQLTKTKNAEYHPVWSPDGKWIAYLGTTRPLTSSETTMENTHLWVMNGDGSQRHEAQQAIDNRHGAPRWSADGRALMFTVQERGNTTLYELPATGGTPAIVVGDKGTVGAWSITTIGPATAVAYALATPASPAELFMKRDGAAAPLTSLNRSVLDKHKLGTVESFTFSSFDGTAIEAFLTRPVDVDVHVRASRPLIVIMHGGPHGQQGVAFNSRAQVYASQGWASLMVNYRGSTGYGQKLTDAIFGDQNGGEAKDVLAGVDAALKRYPWIDGSRMGLEGGSYGGQLTNWIVAQTDRFKAAIPSAGISNLVTQNYLSYYHDYLAVEYGAFPHQNGIIDKLWERSPIRYAGKVKTPTLFIHGENDNDVPIAEAEQFYIALKDVGVETVMVRYPREGHGLRETGHVVDALERSIAWYERHFSSSEVKRTF